MLKAFPGLILCPRYLQLVFTGSGRDHGRRCSPGTETCSVHGDMSLGNATAKDPTPVMCRSIPRGMLEGVQPQCWDKLHDQGLGRGTVPHPQLDSQCWRRAGGISFSRSVGSGVKRPTAPGDVRLHHPVSSHRSFTPEHPWGPGRENPPQDRVQLQPRVPRRCPGGGWSPVRTPTPPEAAGASGRH